MGAAEFREWVAYDRIDPLPDPYWTAAMTAWVMARVWGSKTATIADFLPARKHARPRQSMRMQRGLMGGVRRRSQRTDQSG